MCYKPMGVLWLQYFKSWDNKFSTITLLVKIRSLYLCKISINTIPKRPNLWLHPSYECQVYFSSSLFFQLLGEKQWIINTKWNNHKLFMLQLFHPPTKPRTCSLLDNTTKLLRSNAFLEWISRKKFRRRFLAECLVSLSIWRSIYNQLVP